MNRFKGLDLVVRVPEEFWTEVRNIVQEAVNESILKKNKSKKTQCFSEVSLQIAKEKHEKPREKGKGSVQFSHSVESDSL